jgi:hypothetical protein
MSFVFQSRERHTQNKPMRKLLFALTLFLCFYTSGKAQEFEIACTEANADAICCGFSETHRANVGVIRFPRLSPPINAGVVYKWYALHEKANKFWDTPVPARQVPVPWAGTYRVYVLISYVDKTTFRTLATFRSNTIELTVMDCDKQSNP